MAVTAMNTRIVLRNDMLSAWEGSNKKLLKGEMALARLSGELSDKFEVRIGVGNKTWNELSSSNFMIPAENVVGLIDSINAVQTKFYEVSSFSELPTTGVTNGSIGVVLETVTVAETDPEYAGLSADGKQLSTEYRTAYWFDTELSAWRQMDGNYKAENVYFTSNLKLTESFGRHAGVKTGYTLSCKNMSLTDVLKEAYAETKQPTITQPSVGFALDKTSNSGEVGASYTLPAKATFTYSNDGNYEYGPATGVTVSASISAEAKTGMAGTAKSGMVETDTLSAVANVTSAYVAGATTYNYKAYYTWTEGVTPKNNIGGDATVKPIQAKAQTELTASYTATGKYPYFMFYTMGTACPDTINTSTASSVTKDNKTVDGKKCTQLLTAGTVYKTLEQIPENILIGNENKSGSYQNVYVVLPENTKNDWDGTMSNGVDGVAIQLVHKKDVTVTLLNGNTKAYTAFMIENSATVNDYLCQMKWS